MVIDPCPPEVAESTADLALACRGVAPGDQVTWWYQPAGSSSQEAAAGRQHVGTCDPLPAACLDKLDGFMRVSRPAGDVSVLTVRNVSRLYAGATLTCTTRTPPAHARSGTTACKLNVVCE